MTAKRRRYLVCAAFALLTLAGCTQEEDFSPMQMGLPMSVSADITSAVATRAGASLDQLESGFTFSAVPSVDENGAYSYENIIVKGNNTDGWKFYDADGTTEKQLLWKDYTTAVNFTASYPTGTWTLNADQSSEANYTANDWLYFNATLKNSETTNGKVPITFLHANAKFTVDVELNEMTLPNAQIESVTIGGIQTTVESYDVATNIFTLSGDAGTVKPLQNESKYEAILLPQTASLSVTVKLKDIDKEYVWNQSEDTKLKSGLHYTLKLLVIDPQPIAVGEVKVEKWTDEAEEVVDNTETRPVEVYIGYKAARMTIGTEATAADIAWAVAEVAATKNKTIHLDGTITQEQVGYLQDAIKSATVSAGIAVYMPDMVTEDEYQYYIAKNGELFYCFVAAQTEENIVLVDNEQKQHTPGTSVSSDGRVNLSTYRGYVDDNGTGARIIIYGAPEWNAYINSFNIIYDEGYAIDYTGYINIASADAVDLTVYCISRTSGGSNVTVKQYTSNDAYYDLYWKKVFDVPTY